NISNFTIPEVTRTEKHTHNFFLQLCLMAPGSSCLSTDNGCRIKVLDYRDHRPLAVTIGAFFIAAVRAAGNLFGMKPASDTIMLARKNR
ncbi:MAG: hypothetical protein OQK97_04870, partial [Deltaproteobacteria bacterium]|nr:hypothetical protein [Deltaproteobacteria bacterium]